MKNVAVTAGYICPEPRKRFFAAMDAANVDLKAFSERFYEKRCVGALEPVKDTLKYLDPRDRGLDRDHDADHPRRERFGRGARGAQRAGSRAS